MEYNHYMGSIDRFDITLSSTECVRRTAKWYKKLFFHTVDLSLLNGNAIYQFLTGRKVSLCEFQYQVMKHILGKYYTPINNI